jgi:hypothetical protein
LNRTFLPAACLCVLLVPASRLDAQVAPAPDEGTTITRPGAGRVGPLASSISFLAQEQGEQAPKKKSPWMLLPLVASSPKMGTSVGFLGSYLHYFDPKSQVSMFGLAYEYSSTKSQVGAVFARTSFAEDHQRLEGIVAYGYVRNEYKDYLGTGKTVRTTDEITMGFGRYFYRVRGPWFIGADAAYGNYSVEGETEMQNKALNLLGLTGFHIGGAGPILMFDSRDNQDMPVRGWYSNLNYFANRTWLGSEDDFDTFRLDFKGFVPHGKGHVFALRENNQWTYRAPTSAESSVEVRGYKIEQYLGKHMSSIEGEERLRFSKRCANIFGGRRGSAGVQGWSRPTVTCSRGRRPFTEAESHALNS